MRIQTPNQRREVALDEAEVEAYVKVAMVELGFPEDWLHESGWDCASSTEPVHPDYWRKLVQVQHELRVKTGENESLRLQLSMVKADLARAVENYGVLAHQLSVATDGRTILQELKTYVDGLRDSGTDGPG